MSTQAVTRKRGPKSLPVSQQGYVRWKEAIELFRPLSQNAFHYRVHSKDIDSIVDGGDAAYSIESIMRWRTILLEENATKSQRKASEPMPAKEPSWETRIAKLERKIAYLEGKVSFLESQLSE